MKIRIIDTPPGSAPEGVRKRWLRAEMTTIGRENSSDDEGGHIRVGNENLGGYKVLGSEALKCLQTHSQEAYQFWGSYINDDTVLVFRADVCEEIPG